ncbi:TetR/AcrR family transcriptional regulator [Actinomadura keratinilytica]|jgi:AcrR family transcriptional regulator|uniref:TetR/AcrR family transcriptional regulator n=1 Tax=Actinomadura keratinilytica TaxID=547461 RepID=A0ABP7Z7T0_9ACTN
MARPRQFDEDRAVEAAMRAFWAAGYEATSTEDLCAATGLARSSVYNAFGGKRDLFGRALRRYAEAKDADMMEVLESDLPVREKVRTLMWRAVEPDPDDPAGCLVVNTLVELGPRDPETAAWLRRNYDRRFEALRAALDRGRRDGEIDPGKDPAALAHFVIAAISGMRVAARGGAGRDVLEAVARTALDAL